MARLTTAITVCYNSRDIPRMVVAKLTPHSYEVVIACSAWDFIIIQTHSGSGRRFQRLQIHPRCRLRVVATSALGRRVQMMYSKHMIVLEESKLLDLQTLIISDVRLILPY